jgi:O-antigen ligase
MKLTLSYKRNLLVLGASLAAIGYIFSIATTSIGLILFLFTWLLNFTELNLRSIYKINRLHYLVLFFLILAIGIFYSLDLQQAQKDIVRHLSFILLPIVFLTLKPFNKREYYIVIKIYVYAVTLLFLICFANAIYRQVIFSNQGGSFNWYFFYRYDLLEIFDQHPTYVSMYGLLSLSILLDKRKIFFKKKWILLLVIFIQGLSIVLYGSRIGYIILLILIFAHIYINLKLKSKKEKGRLTLIYLLSIIILLTTSWNIPIVKERIQFTLGYQQDYKFNNQEAIKNSTPEEQGRFLLWKDAFELIKEKPLFGYGTGSNHEVLSKKYKEKGHQLFLEKRYNAHNTYLDLLLTGGIPLLLIYLSILGNLLYIGFYKKNYIVLSFFLILAITGLTETIFRSQGIIFFAFFYCFLLSTNTNNE